MPEPTVGSARIDLHVTGEPGKDDGARGVGVGERRPRKGALRSKPVREFTVYTSVDGPGTPARADRIETVGDWFTLYLDGQEVYGAPRDKVLKYTAKPVTEVA